MATRTEFELKVGIFVFIGLILLSVIIFSIGDLHLFRRGYCIRTLFGFASGIEKGAPVRLAGVEIGEIKDILIYYDEESQRTTVEIKAWIQEGANIEEDAQVYISTLGLLGEKYLEIIPGTLDSEFVKDGDIILGTDPISTERLAQIGRQVLLRFDQTIESINKIISDEEVRESFKVAIKNSKDITTSLKTAISSIDNILEKIDKGEGSIGKFINEDTLYNNVEELTETLKRHPWLLLKKGKVPELKKDKREERESGVFR